MHNHLEALCATISSRDGFQAKFLANSRQNVTKALRQDAELYIQHYLAHGESMSSLADAYLDFVRMTNAEQVFFAREGRYRHSSFKEVEHEVYHNPDIMRIYMLGLSLSAFLWPQHQKIYSFFQDWLRKQRGAPAAGEENRYLEIGPGHGLFFLCALRCGNFTRHTGLDLSQSSIELTRSLAKSDLYCNSGADFELIQADFLTYDCGSVFGAAVMGEVLEHVEEPAIFVKRFADCLRPGGGAFLSTCVNSPAPDHIRNFVDLREIEELFASASLRIADMLIIPYGGKTVEQCLKKRYPINMAYALEKH